MNEERPTIPVVPPASWLRPHAEHLVKALQGLGHDEVSTASTLTVALIEEAALFTAAYTRWTADPRKVYGEADIHLALAGMVLAAYALDHQLGNNLDDWCALKLRHIEADGTRGWKRS